MKLSALFSFYFGFSSLASYCICIGLHRYPMPSLPVYKATAGLQMGIVQDFFPISLDYYISQNRSSFQVKSLLAALLTVDLPKVNTLNISDRCSDNEHVILREGGVSVGDYVLRSTSAVKLTHSQRYFDYTTQDRYASILSTLKYHGSREMYITMNPSFNSRARHTSITVLSPYCRKEFRMNNLEQTRMYAELVYRWRRFIISLPTINQIGTVSMATSNGSCRTLYHDNTYNDAGGLHVLIYPHEVKDTLWSVDMKGNGLGAITVLSLDSYLNVTDAILGNVSNKVRYCPNGHSGACQTNKRIAVLTHRSFGDFKVAALVSAPGDKPIYHINAKREYTENVIKYRSGPDYWIGQEFVPPEIQTVKYEEFLMRGQCAITIVPTGWKALVAFKNDTYDYDEASHMGLNKFFEEKVKVKNHSIHAAGRKRRNADIYLWDEDTKQISYNERNSVKEPDINDEIIEEIVTLEEDAGEILSMYSFNGMCEFKTRCIGKIILPCNIHEMFSADHSLKRLYERFVNACINSHKHHARKRRWDASWLKGVPLLSAGAKIIGGEVAGDGADADTVADISQGLLDLSKLSDKRFDEQRKINEAVRQNIHGLTEAFEESRNKSLERFNSLVKTFNQRNIRMTNYINAGFKAERKYTYEGLEKLRKESLANDERLAKGFYDLGDVINQQGAQLRSEETIGRINAATRVQHTSMISKLELIAHTRREQTGCRQQFLRIQLTGKNYLLELVSLYDQRYSEQVGYVDYPQLHWRCENGRMIKQECLAVQTNTSVKYVEAFKEEKELVIAVTEPVDICPLEYEDGPCRPYIKTAQGLYYLDNGTYIDAKGKEHKIPAGAIIRPEKGNKYRFIPYARKDRPSLTYAAPTLYTTYSLRVQHPLLIFYTVRNIDLWTTPTRYTSHSPYIALMIPSFKRAKYKTDIKSLNARTNNVIIKGNGMIKTLTDESREKQKEVQEDIDKLRTQGGDYSILNRIFAITAFCLCLLLILDALYLHWKVRYLTAALAASKAQEMTSFSNLGTNGQILGGGAFIAQCGDWMVVLSIISLAAQAFIMLHTVYKLKRSADRSTVNKVFVGGALANRLLPGTRSLPIMNPSQFSQQTPRPYSGWVCVPYLSRYATFQLSVQVAQMFFVSLYLIMSLANVRYDQDSSVEGIWRRIIEISQWLPMAKTYLDKIFFSVERDIRLESIAFMITTLATLKICVYCPKMKRMSYALSYYACMYLIVCIAWLPFFYVPSGILLSDVLDTFNVSIYGAMALLIPKITTTKKSILDSDLLNPASKVNNPGTNYNVMILSGVNYIKEKVKDLQGDIFKETDLQIINLTFWIIFFLFIICVIITFKFCCWTRINRALNALALTAAGDKIMIHNGLIRDINEALIFVLKGTDARGTLLDFEFIIGELRFNDVILPKDTCRIQLRTASNQIHISVPKEFGNKCNSSCLRANKVKLVTFDYTFCIEHPKFAHIATLGKFCLMRRNVNLLCLSPSECDNLVRTGYVNPGFESASQSQDTEMKSPRYSEQEVKLVAAMRKHLKEGGEPSTFSMDDE